MLKIQKLYLIPPCLTLSINYEIRVRDKVEQSREKNCALPYTSVYWLLKRELSRNPPLRLPTLLYIYIYIYIYIIGTTGTLNFFAQLKEPYFQVCVLF